MIQTNQRPVIVLCTSKETKTGDSKIYNRPIDSNLHCSFDNDSVGVHYFKNYMYLLFVCSLGVSTDSFTRRGYWLRYGYIVDQSNERGVS